MANPSYILNGIAPWLRAAISAEAEAEDVSLADTMRAALCEHYGLDCPPKGRGYEPDRDEGSPSMVLRVSPELFAAIKADSEQSGETMRTVILNILEAHYEGVRS